MPEGDGLALFGGSQMEYRYKLRRFLGAFGDKGTCLFIMLNPSTADWLHNDPTIRRCIDFAKRWGYKWLDVVNLFGLRATNPDKLKEASDPVGPGNDQAILDKLKLVAGNEEGLAVAAWGNHGAYMDRSTAVRSMADMLGCSLWTFGFTDAGEPKHPLYVAKETSLVNIAALTSRDYGRLF